MAVRGRAVHKNHNPVFHYLLLTIFFIIVAYPAIVESTKGVEMKLGGFGFKVLPFIDNSHLGSILGFQPFSCLTYSVSILEPLNRWIYTYNQKVYYS